MINKSKKIEEIKSLLAGVKPKVAFCSGRHFVYEKGKYYEETKEGRVLLKGKPKGQPGDCLTAFNDDVPPGFKPTITFK